MADSTKPGGRKALALRPSLFRSPLSAPQGGGSEARTDHGIHRAHQEGEVSTVVLDATHVREIARESAPCGEYQSSEALEPYLYAPLGKDQIRLFYADYSHPIEEGCFGTLRAVEFAGHNPGNPNRVLPVEHVNVTAHTYEALSYTWGDQSETFPLICGGKELRIHANLRDALTSLRQVGTTLPIWIDAISIDQQDEHEKISQIQLMCKIYREASRVWAWIGNAIDSTEAAIPVMHQLIASRLEITKKAAIEFSVRPEAVQLPPSTSPVWEALCNIVSSPWFNRLWILQEAAFASEINFVCGPHVFEWNFLWHLMDMGHLISRLALEQEFPVGDGRLSQINKHVFEIRRCTQALPPGRRKDDVDFNSTILNVVGMSTKQFCTEPRDRVLGLLGFLSDDDRASLHIHPDESIEDLSLKFCHFLLQEYPSQGFMFTYGLIAPRRLESTLPSWCPNFAATIPPQLQNETTIFYAASSKNQQVRPGQSISEIIVSGCRVDQVVAVVPGSWIELLDDGKPPEMAYLTKALAENLDWEQSCLRLSMSEPVASIGLDDLYGFSSEIPDQHWRTLIVGKDKIQGMPVTLDDYKKVYRWMRAMAQVSHVFESQFGRLCLSKANPIQMQIAHDWISSKAAEARQETANSFRMLMEGAKIEDCIPQTENELASSVFQEYIVGPLEDFDADPTFKFNGDIQFEGMAPLLAQAFDATAALDVTAHRYLQWLTGSSGQRYFKTESGRVGLSQVDIQVDDHICVFDGAAYPDVLRPECTGDRFKLLGHAYVHGIMYGEVDTLGLPSQDFTLV